MHKVLKEQGKVLKEKLKLGVLNKKGVLDLHSIKLTLVFKMFKNKKGSVMIYLVFMLTALFVVLLAGVFAPMGVQLNSVIYAEAESIMLDANTTVQNISNTDVRNQLEDMFESSMNAQQNNIEVNNAIFQYGWIIAIILTGLVLFLITRSLVEFRQGGGLI